MFLGIRGPKFWNKHKDDEEGWLRSCVLEHLGQEHFRLYLFPLCSPIQSPSSWYKLYLCHLWKAGILVFGILKFHG